MKEKSKVPALDKADKIFNYLHYKYSATQSEIANDLNLPKATVNRILSVLLQLKYLNYENKHYFIGEKFYFFANKYEKYTLLKKVTYPYLENLSLKFKETFKLSVLDEGKIRTIAKVESSDLVKITVSENAIFPLHAGAASKLLICQLSESKLNKLLDKCLPKYTDNTITDRDELKKELMKINFHKISFDNLEHSKSIMAVAVPILNKKNRIVAAISCPYFPNTLSSSKIDSIISEMKKCCFEISQIINF